MRDWRPRRIRVLIPHLVFLCALVSPANAQTAYLSLRSAHTAPQTGDVAEELVLAG